MDARLESQKIARIPDLLDLIKRLCSCCVSDGKNALDAYVSHACTMPMYQSLQALVGRDRPWRHSWLMTPSAQHWRHVGYESQYLENGMGHNYAPADYAREIIELCFHGFSHYAREILIICFGTQGYILTLLYLWSLKVRKIVPFRTCKWPLKNKIKINSTGSRTGQVKNKESYNSLVKNHLSASVGRHHPMIRRQMRLLNGGGG